MDGGLCPFYFHSLLVLLLSTNYSDQKRFCKDAAAEGKTVSLDVDP